MKTPTHYKVVELTPEVIEKLDNERTYNCITDCEDSCIITNEVPIQNIDWVANINHPDYKGYNPFNQTIH